jgi:hypothetical protein
MSDLTPVQRPDYTGKVVTRHVKTAQTPPGARNIAPPTLARQPSVYELREGIAEAMQLPLNDLHSAVQDVHKLEAIHSLVHSHDFTVCGPELMDNLSWVNGDDFDDCVAILERNFNAADRVMSALPSKVLAFRASVPMLVCGINQHKFEMTPDDEAVLIESLCRIWTSPVLDDDDGFMEKVFEYRNESIGKYEPRSALYDDLAQYIVQHPDKSDLIVKMITERKISDVADIDKMINSIATPSLIDGVL